MKSKTQMNESNNNPFHIDNLFIYNQNVGQFAIHN